LRDLKIDPAGFCVCVGLTLDRYISDDEVMALAGKPLTKDFLEKYEVTQGMCRVLMIDAADASPAPRYTLGSSLASSVMLVAALGTWPYGYYMLLRVVVCVAAAFFALGIYRRTGELTLWCAIFIAMTVIFNLLVPVHSQGAFGRSSILSALHCSPFISS
jgi:hypothetical protein